MILSYAEKAEIVRTVSRSELGVNQTLKRLGVHKRTFYNWYHRYALYGEQGLKPRRESKQQWNALPQDLKNLVAEVALEHTELSSRQIATKIVDEQAIFICESSVYRILKANGLIQIPEHVFIKAADEYHTKTKFVNQMWQTDFTYFKITGWGWYYLSTVIDDHSRYIVHWELCENMKKEDVKRTIARAMAKAKLSKANAPTLLSDNGKCYIAKDVGEYLNENFGIDQLHGAPSHPQTQGKIERYHRSMKSVVKLHKYYCPSELETAISKWVEYYNNCPYHESLDNLTPADVYFGRGEQIIRQKLKIKEQSLEQRRRNYYENKLKSEQTLQIQS